jgi:UDP-2,4-diacetamido-2,4,6-trideoxy-beta-L-altropyranose hydrolase
MFRQKVYFRTDANTKIGMGHLVRCSALAKMIENQFEIGFVIRYSPSAVVKKFLNPDYEIIALNESNEIEEMISRNILSAANIIVLDSYDFDSSYQSRVKSSGVKVVFIDDIVAFDYDVDVIINQADNIKEVNYSTLSRVKFCLGSKFILLRDAFLNATVKSRELKRIESVFVSFGGADMDNVSRKVLKVLSRFPQLKNIHVLSSSVNENIAKWSHEFINSRIVKFHNDLAAEEVCNLMQSCELALGPCSNLALELCSIGIVFITGTTASNQVNYYDALTGNSCALGIGIWQELSEEDLYNKVASVMIYDEKDIAWFVRNQRNYIDGQSGKRLLNIFLDLANS